MTSFLTRASIAGLLSAFGLACTPAMLHAAPQENSFTYQGVLEQGGSPFDGLRDFRFSLFDAEVGGALVDRVQAFSVDVSEGIFAVELAFPQAVWESNEQLWLEIEAGPADGSQSYEIIGRQKVTGTPYALNTRGLYVNDAGEVSIGTPSDEGGNLKILPTTGNANIILRGAGQPSLVNLGVGGNGIAIGTQDADFSNYERKFRFNYDGKLEIGTNPADAYVNIGPVGSEDNVRLLSFAEAGNPNFWVEGDFAATGGANRLSIGSNLLPEVLTIKADGSVGIGTSAPSLARLAVHYSDLNGIEVADTDPLSAGIGVAATVGFGTGLRGEATASTGSNYGVLGKADGSTSWGVFSNGRFASSGTKSFVIDHPLDPAGGFLIHYSSEAPEPQNRYNGNVTLDERGVGIVTLPVYFEAVNTDFRYILTPIGAPAPNLHVAAEVQGNRFAVAGGVPGQRVSWEVVARRNDAYVAHYGAPIEVPKVGDEVGRYLSPELFGESAEKGLFAD
ncbi:MAG: hypothetical protein RIB60_11305 [Phycisphaerales bacterium]